MKSLAMLGILGAASTPVGAVVQPTAPSTPIIDMGHSTWISKFSTTETSYNMNADNYWSYHEKLLENNKYIVKNVGAIGTHDVFDVFVKEINKHYEIMFNQEPFDKSNNVKNLINVDFANKIISDFESKMISKQYKTNSILVHNGQGLKITKNGSVDFHSSWGVYNSDSGDVRANSIITSTKLNEVFKESETDASHQGRATYSNYTLTNINYLPLVEVTNPPITSSTFSLSSVIVNGSTLNNPSSMHPNLPSGAGAGTEWWHGITSSIVPVISILGAPFSAGTSLGLGIIAGGLSYNSGEDGHVYSPQQKQLIERLLKNTITTKAQIPVNSGVSTSFLGSLSGRANATGIFGDRSQMDLKDLYVSYNVQAIAKIYAN